MSDSLQSLYAEWRAVFHNHHHERFSGRQGYKHHVFAMRTPHYFVAGKCLVALALLNNCVMPFAQCLGKVVCGSDLFRGKYWFLVGNEGWLRRLAYYSQSLRVYSYKFSSVAASCGTVGLLWWQYPRALGMTGPYVRHYSRMLCRNQMRHRHKNVCTKLALLLSCLPYANNFTALWAVFCFGLALGESVDHLLDGERHAKYLINYRINQLRQSSQTFTVEDRERAEDRIRRQYCALPLTRLLPLINGVASIIVAYSLVGTPERMQLQAVRAYKSRRVLTVVGAVSLMLSVVGHLGNLSYLDSGYYYHFEEGYSFREGGDDTEEWHPLPRDLFEWYSLALIKCEKAVWSLYDIARRYRSR